MNLFPTEIDPKNKRAMKIYVRINIAIVIILAVIL